MFWFDRIHETRTHDELDVVGKELIRANGKEPLPAGLLKKILAAGHEHRQKLRATELDREFQAIVRNS